MRKKIHVILNGKAGRRGIEFSQNAISEAFKKLDPEVVVDFGLTQAPQHAIELARNAAAAGYDVVVDAGGDGTVNEVTNGLAHTGATMGIIPNGSTNVFAQEMQISSEIDRAAEIILGGESVEIDVGCVEGRYFIWMCGVGIEAKIASLVNPKIKKHFGVLAYVFAALRQIFDKAFSLMKIYLDEQEMTFSTFNTVIGNATSFDGFLGIRSRYGIHDGYLDVCILQRKSIAGILKLLIEFGKGRRDYYRFIDKFSAAHCRVKKLRVETVPSAFYHVDGEVMGKTPIEVSVHEKALKLILPLEIKKTPKKQ
jgi:diacylglycerol kinase (ATP)